MKKLFVSLFLLSCSTVFAGPPGSGSFDWISHQKFFALSAGQYEADFTLLNKQLSLWGATNEFTTFYMFGTTSISGATNTKAKSVGSWDGSNSLEFMLPQDVSIGTNDSLKFHLWGWHLMTSSFGKDVIPGDNVALVLAPGFDWGTIKLKRTVNGSSGKYKNPFVAPLARADLRFMIGKFAIGARATYRYDITHSIWKRRNDGLPVLPGTKISGLGLQAFIGWGKMGS